MCLPQFLLPVAFNIFSLLLIFCTFTKKFLAYISYFIKPVNHVIDKLCLFWKFSNCYFFKDCVFHIFSNFSFYKLKRCMIELLSLSSVFDNLFHIFHFFISFYAVFWLILFHFTFSFFICV